MSTQMPSVEERCDRQAEKSLWRCERVVPVEHALSKVAVPWPPRRQTRPRGPWPTVTDGPGSFFLKESRHGSFLARPRATHPITRQAAGDDEPRPGGGGRRQGTAEREREGQREPAMTFEPQTRGCADQSPCSASRQVHARPTCCQSHPSSTATTSATAARRRCECVRARVGRRGGPSHFIRPLPVPSAHLTVALVMGTMYCALAQDVNERPR